MSQNNADNRFQKLEEYKRNETEIKHQIRHLIEFANDWQQNNPDSISHRNPTAPTLELMSLAKKIEQLQKIREKNLGEELSDLGEPVWKILIQLVIATEDAQDMSVADLSSRISLPETTTLRYLGILENTGYITLDHRQPDPCHDQLQLTDQGLAMMRNTLLELDSI